MQSLKKIHGWAQMQVPLSKTTKQQISILCLDRFGPMLVAWVKVFRFISEFRILRLTFFWKVSLKMLNKAIYISFSDICGDFLR